MRKLIFFSGDVATRADTIVAVGPSVEGPVARVIDLQTLNDWNNGSIDSQVKSTL